MLTLHKGKNTKKVNQCLTWIDYCLIWVTEFFLQKKIVHIYPNPWYTISGTLVIHYGIQYCKDTSTWSVTELIVVRSRKIIKVCPHLKEIQFWSAWWMPRNLDWLLSLFTLAIIICFSLHLKKLNSQFSIFKFKIIIDLIGQGMPLAHSLWFD